MTIQLFLTFVPGSNSADYLRPWLLVKLYYSSVQQRRVQHERFTLLNVSERLLYTKWLRPVTNKSSAPNFNFNGFFYFSTPNGRNLRMRMKTLPMAEKQRETPFHLLFKLFLFIYQHKETYVVVPKIESENIECIVPHEIHYCFGCHLRISGETPINLINQERLQAPLRAERKHSKRSNC